jgi:hypothetical protein
VQNERLSSVVKPYRYTNMTTFKLQMTRANFAKTKPEFEDHLQAWRPYLGKMLMKRSSPFKYDHKGEYTRMPGKREQEDIRQLWGTIGTCLCPKMRKLRKKYIKEQFKLQGRHLNDAVQLWQYFKNNANDKTKTEVAQEKAQAFNLKSDVPSEVAASLEEINTGLPATGKMRDRDLKAAFLENLRGGDFDGLVDVYCKPGDKTKYDNIVKAFVRKEDSRASEKKTNKKNSRDAYQVHVTSLQPIEEDATKSRCKDCKNHHKGKCWSGMKCRRCGKMGHIQKFCKGKQEDEARRPPSKRKRSEDTSQASKRWAPDDCQLCNKSNHRARDCPSLASFAPKRRKVRVVKKSDLERRSYEDDDPVTSENDSDGRNEDKHGNPRRVRVLTHQKKRQRTTQPTYPQETRSKVTRSRRAQIREKDEGQATRVPRTRQTSKLSSREEVTTKLLIDTAAQAHVMYNKKLM